MLSAQLHATRTNRPHSTAACVQVLEPVQLALLLIQSETDPIEGMHIANMVALQRKVPNNCPPPIFSDPEAEQIFMKSYAARHDRGREGQGHAAAVRRAVRRRPPWQQQLWRCKQRANDAEAASSMCCPASSGGTEGLKLEEAAQLPGKRGREVGGADRFGGCSSPHSPLRVRLRAVRCIVRAARARQCCGTAQRAPDAFESTLLRMMRSIVSSFSGLCCSSQFCCLFCICWVLLRRKRCISCVVLFCAFGCVMVSSRFACALAAPWCATATLFPGLQIGAT